MYRGAVLSVQVFTQALRCTGLCRQIATVLRGGCGGTQWPRLGPLPKAAPGG